MSAGRSWRGGIYLALIGITLLSVLTAEFLPVGMTDMPDRWRERHPGLGRQLVPGGAPPASRSLGRRLGR
jgi:hypothetical protein